MKEIKVWITWGELRTVEVDEDFDPELDDLYRAAEMDRFRPGKDLEYIDYWEII